MTRPQPVLKYDQMKLLAQEISAYGGTYNPFIRAITGAIAMATTQISRWKKSKTKLRFWNCRPLSCVVKSLRAFQNLRAYIHINELEGQGVPRSVARFLVKSRSDRGFS